MSLIEQFSRISTNLASVSSVHPINLKSVTVFPSQHFCFLVYTKGMDFLEGVLLKRS